VRASYMMRATDLGGRMIVTERGSGAGAGEVPGQQNASGFIGQSRESAPSSSARVSQNTYSLTETSTSVLAANSFVFARNLNGSVSAITNARLSFYSIGASLDLEKLDNRTTRLMNLITYSFTAGLPELATMDLDAASYIGAVYRAGGTLS